MYEIRTVILATIVGFREEQGQLHVHVELNDARHVSSIEHRNKVRG